MATNQITKVIKESIYIDIRASPFIYVFKFLTHLINKMPRSCTKFNNLLFCITALELNKISI